ncbi:MAG: hypothetical protein M3362_12345 [Acidobacteriota bacterium]|nr:hypothetical protein [Acidobacteriota bacterium]
MKQKVKLKVRAVRRTLRVSEAGGLHILLRVPCPSCGREVETFNREQAGEILEVGELELSEMIAAGRIHAIQTASGNIRVCKDSLFFR